MKYFIPDAALIGKGFVVDSLIQGQATSIPAVVIFIYTGGYYVVGDGGQGQYSRVAVEPAHAGKFQSGDGAWWELSSPNVNVLMFGAKNDNTIDSSLFIQNAEDYSLAKTTCLYFIKGTYKCGSSINKKTGIDWQGQGREITTLSYTGADLFLNITGTNLDRIICSIKDICLDGSAANVNAIGLSSGWNQRCTLLNNVKIQFFGKYGIHFNDQNWIVTFQDVYINQCGRGTSNGSGIFKDNTITGGIWNNIAFYNLNIESSGFADSTGGGMFLASDTANRGLYFFNLDCEGCFGENEIYVSNMEALEFHSCYMETTEAANGFNLSGCDTKVFGGFFSGANILNQLIGFRVSAGAGFVTNKLALYGAYIFRYASSVSNGDTTVTTDGVTGDKIYTNLNNGAQWVGDYSPKFAAYNTVNQSIPSGVITPLVCDNEVYDLTSGYDIATSVYTPRTVGPYRFNVQATWVAAVDQDALYLLIYVNGVSVAQSITRASGAGQQASRLTADIDLTGNNDAVTFQVRQTSGSAQDILGSQVETFVSASFLGKVA